MPSKKMRYSKILIQAIILQLLNIVAVANVSVTPISDSIAIAVTKFDGTISEKTIQKLNHNSATFNTIIIDLRDNHGGHLHDAVAFGSLFVTKNQLIELIKNNNEPLIITRPENHPLIKTNAVIVLINENTASAAEATASILKSHPNHLFIGKPTHGKTSIHSNHTQLPYKSMNITNIQPNIEFEWQGNDKETQYLKTLAIKNMTN